MTNEPAFPVSEKDFDGVTIYQAFGLTKREYFAGLGMPVMLDRLYNIADREQKPIENLFKAASAASVEYADALLEALNESK